MTAPPCDVVLAYERAGDTGGVAVDVRHLAQGLPAAGVRPVVARTARGAIGALRGRSPALLHVFGCLPSSLIFRLLPVARAARWRVVWTPVFHPSRPRSWRGYGLLRAMQAFDLAAPRVARFVDAVIAATEEEAALFQRLGARRVALIPPGVAGVSTAGGNGAPPELRAELGLAPGPVVLVVGRDNRRKGLPFALRSFASLRRLRPDAQLLLVGPPADRLAAGVPGVHSRGWLPADETERAYRAADLLLVSSLYEGLPRVVIEAWREGLPVVATDRVALAPTIAGVGGEIVPYGDAERTASVMARLLADPATLASYGAAGRRLVAERFLLSRLVAETADLYRELCGDPACMSESHLTVNVAQATRWHARVAGGTLRAHAAMCAPIVLVALWLLRHDLLSTAFPAGTDMLGLVTRAHENARWDRLLSPWDPGTLGAVRPLTLDNVLGLATLVTGDAIVTVKLAALLTLSLGGGLAYLLAWHWFGRRSTALIAGLLYMTSQASVSRWASGALNVELTIALAPLVIDLWFRCLEAFTVARALRLALAVGVVAFVRFDMVLYLVPFFLGHLVVRACFRGAADTLRAAGRTALVALPALVAIDLVQLFPLAAGLRPAWLTSARLFDVDELRTRSLDALPSLVGFGREIGYLGFTGQQTWYSHPWLPLAGYEAAAAAVVVLAFSALWWRRDERVLSLIAAAVIATFLAKGTHDPAGAPYRWAAEHVPFAGSLRDPNRWLIVQAIAYSLLSALTLTCLADRVRGGVGQRGRTLPRVAVAGVAVALAAALFLPVGPTLVSGLRTWEPRPAELALLAPIREARGDFAVATVPFDQTVRFVEQGSYRGFEHDLGAESALFTDHPALADGGWTQRTADVIAYASTLLDRRDPAFTELMGALGVRYLVAFRYPATAPHLCPPEGSARRCTRQQRAVGRMPGLVPVARNRAGTLSRIPGAAARISFRPNVAVVLGGRSGLAALADSPGVALARWAAFTADDVIATRGLEALVRMIGSADRVVVSNATVQDLAVLAAPAIGSLPGITSDPALDRKTQLVGSDASTRTGSLADQRTPPPRRATRAAASFRMRSAQRLEVWARLAVGPTPGELRFSLDGHRIAAVTPLALEGETFRWWRLTTARLAAGKHRLEVRTAPSPFGADYEVDETKVIAAGARGDAQRRLSSAIRAAGGRVSYDLDRRYLQGAALPPRARTPVDAVAPAGTPFWSAGEPAHTHRAGRAWRYDGRRTAYTILLHRFAKPQDWSDRRYAFLRYRGTGSGSTYRFIADLDRRRDVIVSTAFVDDAPGWRTAALRLPVAAPRVFSLRIGTDSKDTAGSLEPAVPRLGAPLGRLTVSYPLVGRIVRLRVPSGRAAWDDRLRIGGDRPARERPAVPVQFSSANPTTYDLAFRAPEPGVLAFAQAYDERWRLSAAGRSSRPVPVATATNGYRLARGDEAGSLQLKGRRLPAVGLVLSVLALLVIVPFAVADRGAEERDRRPWRPSVIAAARPPWLAVLIVLWAPLAFAVSLPAGVLLMAGVVLAPRLPWWVSWACAISLLATAIVLVAAGAQAAPNRLAVGVLVCMAAASCRLLADAASSRRGPASL